MNDEKEYIQSNEPIFWGLFGFGGMIAAFAVPALLICMLIAGFSDGHEHFHILEVMSHWWGAGALFLILFGLFFHCVHRIYFTLHDLGVHTGRAGKIVFYGLAILMTLASAGALGVYYFGI